MRTFTSLLSLLFLVSCGPAATQRYEPENPGDVTVQNVDSGPFPSLVVHVDFPSDAAAYSAALYVFQGEFEASSPAELEANVQGADPLDEKLIMDHREASDVQFSNLRPGPYTVCATGITGALTDPATQQRVDAMGDSDGSEPMTCQVVTITPTPDTQQLTLKVTPI